MQGTRRKQNREEVRKTILRQAIYMFFTSGIKSVTMDSIALAIKISKRTLYEQFFDKEDLLLDCVKSVKRLSEKKQYDIVASTPDQLKQILLVNRFKTNQFMGIVPKFFEDLRRYPKVIEYFLADQKSLARESAEYLQQGVVSGLFRADIDFETYSYVMSETIRFTISQYCKEPERLVPIMRMLTLINLRGICTPFGLQRLEELIAEDNAYQPGMSEEELREFLQDI